MDNFVYYAHSMRIYDTEREARELRFLRNKFEAVDNPNDGMPSRDSSYYLKKVLNSTLVVCSEYQKHIGLGVYSNLTMAFANEIPCYVMRRRRILGGYRLKRIKGLKIVNPYDWKVHYGKVRTRGGQI